MNEWQPIRIAPSTSWCKPYRKHWAHSESGKIVYVRQHHAVRLEPWHCKCQMLQVSEKDNISLPDYDPDSYNVKWLAMCQIQAD